MKSEPESERFVLCSERILLECRCGERLILLGREEDWYSEGRGVFRCGGCGATVTLANRYIEEDFLDEESLSIRELLRDTGELDR